MNRLLYFVILLLPLLACGKRSSSQAVINRFGTYKLSGCELIVSEAEGGVVKYKLICNQTEVINYTERASKGQRWFLFLDADGRLWFESSDIGTFVWSPEAGRYERFQVASDRKWIDLIPAEVLAAMSKSHRKIFQR